MSNEKLTGLDFITASHGIKHFAVETLTGKFAGIQITDANTTISAILDHNGNSLMTELNLTGKTLQPPAIITTEEKYISSITCSAGGGIAINN